MAGAGTYHYEWREGVRRRVYYADLNIRVAAADKATAVPTPPKNNVVSIPYGTRFTGKDGQFTSYMIEIPPGIRPLTYVTEDRDSHGFKKPVSKDTYLVALPWTYLQYVEYSGTYSHGRAFWAPRRLKDATGELFCAHIPNVYPDYTGLICIGSTIPYATPNKEKADAFRNEFYRSEFNNHATGVLNVPLKYTTPAEWVKDSEADPLCYLTWKEWNSTKHWTIARALESTNKYGIGQTRPY